MSNKNESVPSQDAEEKKSERLKRLQQLRLRQVILLSSQVFS
jgi:hypothetical protein